MDALNRRRRFDGPQPVDKAIVLTEADYALFDALYRHGPLPSHYLYEFAKHRRKHPKDHQARLTQLFHGTPAGHFLTRPKTFFDSFEARYQPMIYDLHPRAIAALSERDRLPDYIPSRDDHLLHRFMGACVGASIELAAKEAGLRYITKSEIFVHPKCPDATRTAPNPLAIPFWDTRLVPDDIFGIEYADGSFLFFAVEIDRNTESIERKDLSQNAYGLKLKGYLEIMREQLFKTRWGLPNLVVLTVTTNARHMRNMMDYLNKQDDPRLHKWFLFKAKPDFGTNWRVPKDVMRDLFTEPWQRANGSTLSIKKESAA